MTVAVEIIKFAGIPLYGMALAYVVVMHRLNVRHVRMQLRACQLGRDVIDAEIVEDEPLAIDIPPLVSLTMPERPAIEAAQ